MGGDEDAKPIHPAVEKVLADAPELVKYKDQVKRTYIRASTLCSFFFLPLRLVVPGEQVVRITVALLCII